ncbi:MAG TPA: RNA methyltransferase [bacterium]|nr:RNA methyltransferase [bacterium]
MWRDYPEQAKDRLKLLDNLRVVLVSPKFPGNLGMTARAMKNCAVSDLRLVAPRAELNKEAYLLAPAGSDILDTAKIHDTLAQAVSDCGLVIGTTRRKGVARRNIITAEQAADMVRPVLAVNRVALVFGAEDNGLSNDDLSICHWMLSMTTGSEAQSFNLSHSVAIILFLINRAVVGAALDQRKLATTRNLEAMFSDIERFLLETGFIRKEDPKRIMTTVRQILHRSGLSERDIKILRGTLRQSRWRIKNPDAELYPRDMKIRLGSRKRKKGKGAEDE